MDYTNTRYKYRKYKNKYFNIIQKGSSNSYRELYKKAVRDDNCSMVRKIRDALSNIYNVVEETKDGFLTKDLFLTSNDFGGICGDFWRLSTVAALDDSVRFTLNKYIREECILVFVNRYVQNLFCIIVNEPNDLLRIYYGENRENIIITYSDEEQNMLPKAESLYNITNNLKKSVVKECHIDGFYYDYKKPQADMKDYPHPNKLMVQTIKEVINSSDSSGELSGKITKWQNWTSWLLTNIINLLINCLHCDRVHLYDVSKYANKNCKPFTLIWQSVNNRPGLYQSVGFRGNPPINFNNLNQILDLQSNKNFVKKKNDKPEWLHMTKNGISYYYNPLTKSIKTSAPTTINEKVQSTRLKWQQDIIKERGYYTKSIAEIPDLKHTNYSGSELIWERGELYRHINTIGEINNYKWYLFFNGREINNETTNMSWDEYVSKIERITFEKVKIISQYADTDDKLCGECSLIEVPIRAKKDCCRHRRCYYKNENNKCLVKR